MTLIEDATGTPRPVVARYLAAVEAELGDLPAEERADLLEDLALHLAEVADEAGDDDLESRLGAPSAYAAELRASAGLGAPSTASGREWRPNQLLTRARGSVVGRRVLEWWPELRVAGWFAVGAILTEMALHLLDFTDTFLASGPLQLVGGVVALRLARRPATTVWGRRARYAVVGAAGVAGVMLMVDASGRDGADLVVDNGTSAGTDYFYPGGPGYTSDGRPITNVYPYSLDGQPLDGVLLYDQDGVPINAGDSFDRPSSRTPIPANQYPRPASPYETERSPMPPPFESTPPTTGSIETTVPAVSTPATPTSMAPGISTPPEPTVVPDSTLAATTVAPDTTPAAGTSPPPETTVTPASAG